MESLIVAAATDEGARFTARHFGDARFYELVRVSSTGSAGIGRVTRETESEGGHASRDKARSIAEMLREKQVSVALSRVFGPNIQRIKRNFVCVIVDHERIDEALEQVVARYDEVCDEYEKGVERGFLDWRA